MSTRLRRSAVTVIAIVLAAGCEPTAAPGDGTVLALPSTTLPATTTGAPADITAAPTPPPPRLVAAVPEPTAPPPEPGAEPGFTGEGTVTVATGGADMADTPGGDPTGTIRQGVVLPGLGESADGAWVRVLTMCDETAWVRRDQIFGVPPAPAAEIGAGFDFADAVIVVDPGHGGPNTGAESPDGLVEKENNLVIAARLRDLLTGPRSIDWETGAVLDGDDIPAAGRVVMTRVGDGAAGDYEAGLVFRAELANTAAAHALVSIHTNAGWDIHTDIPGSDAYYQSHEALFEPSRRLASLVVEELRRGLAPFDADWVGSIVMGAKSRLSPRHGGQYFGLLEAAEVPAVIAEGAYIVNPSEGALLATAEFQQAYADALYRALVRFLTTDDPGGGPNHAPEVWHGSVFRGGPRPGCEVPAQS
ncbi:MAG: N-acetylmuramoyl-L-alanine amidase family protein [Acidimicrobiia bacterium]